MGNDANHDNASILKRGLKEAFGFSVDDAGRVLNIDEESPEKVAALRYNLIMRPAEIMGAVGVRVLEGWGNVQGAIDQDQNRNGDVLPGVLKITARQLEVVKGQPLYDNPVVVRDYALSPNCGTFYTHATVDGLLDRAIKSLENHAEPVESGHLVPVPRSQ